MSCRQFKRIFRRWRAEAGKGLAHRSRVRPSNNRIHDGVRVKVLEIIGEKYADFAPRLASEKLAERDGICVSKVTFHKWIIAEGLWKPKTRRERRRCYGETAQIEMKIDNIEDAKRFLADEYLPLRNQRFRVEPASKANAHRRLTKGFNLNTILSRHHERRVANDYTIRWNNRLFQIGKPAHRGLRADGLRSR